MDRDHTLSLAQRRCPGFAPSAVMARTGKTLLVAGTYRQQPAVAKLLIEDADLWRRRFAAEARTCQVFATHTPPVPVPLPLCVDVQAGVLVLQRVHGSGVAASRHPTTALSEQVAAAVVSTVEAIAAWKPPAGAFETVFDYPERFSRYGPHGHGLLNSGDLTALNRIYTALASNDDVWVFAHGDALASNLLLTGPDLTVVDWEWAGMYLPGFDHALLWSLLSADSRARRSLVSSATAGPWTGRAGMWVNAALALTREIRLHRELDANPVRDRILTRLQHDLNTVRHELARLNESLPCR